MKQWTHKRWMAAGTVGAGLLVACGGGDGPATPGTGSGTSAANAAPVIAAAVRKPAPKLAKYFGALGSAGYANGTGSAAKFNFPLDLGIDAAGNLYVTETPNSTVRMISPTGATTLLAGIPGQPGYRDGPATSALFASPEGVAVDSSGNVFVADTGNNVIREIAARTGIVSTFAGTAGAIGSADGTGANAQFSGGLFTMAVDSANNLYVADGPLIRKITPGAQVTTLQFTASPTFYPYAVAVDNGGTVYITSADNTVASISPNGAFTIIAGTAGVTGNVDGVGAAASFDSMCGIAVDNQGHVFVTDSNDDVRMITLATQAVTTIAGMANVFGKTNGTGSAARFFNLNGMTIDPKGNLYVADSDNNAVRQLTPKTKGTGKKATTVYATTTLAGAIADAGSVDGDSSSARFGLTNAMAYDAAGNLWVVDAGGYTVREITTAGQVTTVAGSAGVVGASDGTGSSASFNFGFFGNPGLAALPSGNIAVTDWANHTVRMITPNGVVTTLAGAHGSCGAADGAGNAAMFCYPSGLAADALGNLYVADQINNTIRVVSPTGVVSTLAGSPGMIGSSDGTGSAALFNGPTGIVLGQDGALYVSDSGNGTIRRVTLAGTVTTVAGTAGVLGNQDGTGAAASFHSPYGMAVSASGMIYVTDSVPAFNQLVRSFNPSTGAVTTLLGAKNAPAGWAAGALPGGLVWPHGLAISGTSLYISTEQGIAVASNAVQ